MKTGLLINVQILMLLGCAHIHPHAGQPKTERVQVVDTYHDTEVIDEYRWLENYDDPKVKEWNRAQNEYTRSKLDSLPRVPEIRTKVGQILNDKNARYYSISKGGDKLFAIKYMPPANQPFLVMFSSMDKLSGEKILLDLNKLDSEGSLSIDWYVPSPDGSLLAVSLSKSGSEIGDLYIYETETGSETGVVIERVNAGTAGGDLAWTPDGSGFYYTRYPRKGDPKPGDETQTIEDLAAYQQLWFHKIGEGVEKDSYEIGRGFASIAEIEVDIDDKTGLVLASVQYGDSGRFAYHIKGESGRWKQIIGYDDGIKEVLFGPKEDLFLVTKHEAPKGKVLYLPTLDTPLNEARRIVAEKESTISTAFYKAQTMVVTENRIFVTYQLGGPSEIRVFDHDGNQVKGPKIPPISRIGRRIIPLGGDDILFSVSSFLKPTGWYRYFGETGKTKKTKLSSKSNVSFSDIEVVREFTTSKDGTRLPINIIRKKGIKLKGQHPTLLTGYGGYGASMSPYFDPLLRIWLDAGGVFAIANIRGGGEYGEKWHKDGILGKKQNTFDDFYACMRYLVKSKYTTEEKLAIEGGSNGGLLMGAMITQNPDAAKAVVSHVGIYDMLRNELSSNGKFNIPEFGTVENKANFNAMYTYSPYHRVEDRTAYPAVLFMTGANDARVDPMHSRKMLARLQSANSGDNPILIRTNANTGHGGGTPLKERIEQHVDVLAFLFHQLEM